MGQLTIMSSGDFVNCSPGGVFLSIYVNSISWNIYVKVNPSAKKNNVPGRKKLFVLEY